MNFKEIPVEYQPAYTWLFILKMDRVISIMIPEKNGKAPAGGLLGPVSLYIRKKY